MSITTSNPGQIAFTNGVSTFTISANASGKTLIDFVAVVAAGDGIGTDPVTVTWDLQYYDTSDATWRTFLNIGSGSSNTNPLVVFRIAGAAAFNQSNWNACANSTTTSVGTVMLVPDIRILITVNSSGANGRIDYRKTIIA